MLPYRPANRPEGTIEDVRRGIIDAISNYYRFLTRLPHIDPDCLVFPPEPDGWESIKEDELRARGRSDGVIEVLRHIPYLRNRALPWDLKNNVTNDSTSIAYCDGELEPAYYHQHQPTPGHIIWLAIRIDPHGSDLLLDTQAGTITTFSTDHRGPRLPDAYDFDDGTLDPADTWMNFPTLPVEYFFERCRRRYETLIWLPVPGLQMGDTKGFAFHYERIIDQTYADYFLYPDDDYVDEGNNISGSDSSDNSGSDSEDAMQEDNNQIPEDEVDQLMEDAGPNGNRWIEEPPVQSEVSSQDPPASTPHIPAVEDEYVTDFAYEHVPDWQKQGWQDTKETYFIYKNSGWPALDYDRARCTQQLKEWLENKERKGKTT